MPSSQRGVALVAAIVASLVRYNCGVCCINMTRTCAKGGRHVSGMRTHVSDFHAERSKYSTIAIVQVRCQLRSLPRPFESRARILGVYSQQV
jgi:hypothetical protein